MGPCLSPALQSPAVFWSIATLCKAVAMCSATRRSSAHDDCRLSLPPRRRRAGRCGSRWFALGAQHTTSCGLVSRRTAAALFSDAQPRPPAEPKVSIGAPDLQGSATPSPAPPAPSITVPPPPFIGSVGAPPPPRLVQAVPPVTESPEGPPMFNSWGYSLLSHPLPDQETQRAPLFSSLGYGPPQHVAYQAPQPKLIDPSLLEGQKPNHFPCCWRVARRVRRMGLLRWL